MRHDRRFDQGTGFGHVGNDQQPLPPIFPGAPGRDAEAPKRSNAMTPHQIDLESDDGAEIQKNASLRRSVRLRIWLKQLHAGRPPTPANDNKLAWPLIPFPDDWCDG
jgi:hypothetical protein